MDSRQHHERQRSELSYSLHGLCDREMTLFKSFVRLIDHLTHQHWTCTQGEGQLRVVGAAVVGEFMASAVPVLVIGTAAPSSFHAIALPIHANDLERELNALGDLIEVRVPVASVATTPGTNTIKPNDRVLLTRWPTPKLLTTRDRIRLATLMTGRPLTLRDIHTRSGVPEGLCSEFITELARTGMLKCEHSDTPPRTTTPPSTTVIQGGLLTRIRLRLGLTTVALSA